MADLGRWATVDPGEDTGWTTWHGERLVSAGTSKLWDYADQLWYDATSNGAPDSTFRHDALVRNEAYNPDGKLELVVCEDFRIYPWKARDLAWDRVRTARLIGAITFICRLHSIPMVLQPASIKDRAVQGGAEELCYRPLHENRHQNDALMHAWFYIQTQLKGLHVPAASEGLSPVGPGAPD